jgi:arginine-tRNA-protein transferase
MSKVSIVADCGDNVSKCGYTKKPDASFTHGIPFSIHILGIWAYNMTCSDYQELIDRNWRRSGKYLYKPDPTKSAIIQYTIRLDSTKFQPEKSTHPKVVSKLSNFLTPKVEPKEKITIDPNQKELLEMMTGTFISLLDVLKLDDNVKSEAIKNQKELIQVLEAKDKKFHYYSNFLLRFSNFLKKHKSDILIGTLEEHVGKLIKIDFQVNKNMIHFAIKNPKEKIVLEKETETKNKKLTIKMVPSAYSQESYDLYKKYQMSVHKDKESKITPEGYKNFLVDSPLYFEKTGKEGKMKLCKNSDLPGLENMTCDEFLGYGSYHVEYRLDGKLIMVAVIDMLPKCLSSVYLYYDPDMSSISPGVYSSLSEILYVRSLSTVLPECKYYYLGYYIHDVQKMEYKGQYQPSQLLCPTFLVYVEMKDVLELVEQDCNLAPEKRILVLSDGKGVKPTSSNSITCFHDGKLYEFEKVKHLLSKETIKTIQYYSQLVGPTLSKRMAFVLNM